MKKNHAIKVFVCTLILLLLSTCSALAAQYTGTVNADSVFFRTRPQASGGFHGRFDKGDKVTVTGTSGDFYKVEANGKNGYVMSKDLTAGASAGTMYVRTNTGIGLNLRQGPSTNSAIITSYPIGTAVQVLKKGNGWYQVQVGDNTGYMSSRYLSASKAPQYTKPVAQPYTATLKNINGGSIVNFRLYPGMKTKVLDTLKVGTKVTVLEEGVNWSKVQLEDGRTGYVSTYFLVK